jgi:hypothetical protein
VIAPSPHNVQPKPATLKQYAVAFSEKLGREVTVAELEG